MNLGSRAMAHVVNTRLEMRSGLYHAMTFCKLGGFQDGTLLPCMHEICSSARRRILRVAWSLVSVTGRHSVVPYLPAHCKLSHVVFNLLKNTAKELHTINNGWSWRLYRREQRDKKVLSLKFFWIARSWIIFLYDVRNSRLVLGFFTSFFCFEPG